MNKYIILSTILLNSLLHYSCFAQNEPTYMNYPIVKKSEIKHFDIKEGVYDHAFLLDNGNKWHTKISIPEIKKGEKVPLVIALHWAGGQEAYREFSSCLAFPALDFLNAIIIAPSAEGGHWLDSAIEKRVITLVKQLKKHWPIDDKKIIVTGYSNGGIGTWHYAKTYPNLFCAGLPLAGYYDTEKVDIPLYAIHGEKDELFDSDEVEMTLKRSIEKGNTIKYEIIPNFTHYSACSYAENLKKMAVLMKAELWE